MYIGNKKIAQTTETEEKTPGGVALVEVKYEDGSVERFSKLMYDVSASEKAQDDTALRVAQIGPVVAVVASVLRDWGMKVGALPYFSALLNQSLNFNVEEATKDLWAKFMPRPLSLDDVDLVTIDRVLTAHPPQRKTLDDVL